MKSIIFAAFLVTLAGCTSDPAKEYATQHQAAVLTGQMKWSTYYQGMYDRAAASKRTDSRELLIYSNLLSSAQQYEHGQISLAEFQNIQRMSEIEKRRAREARSTAWAASASQALGAAKDTSQQNAYAAQQRAGNQLPINQQQPVNIYVQPQPSLMPCFGCK